MPSLKLVHKIHSLLRSPYVSVFWSQLLVVGKDDNQWFAAHFIQLADLFDKMYFYTNANRFVQVETFTVFPNQWIQTCIAFDSVVGAVQWVARGELVGNDTFAFAGISNSSNIPTDLAGKLILGKPSKQNISF